MPNSVVYEDPAVLEAALPDFAHAYEQAAIQAWTVWVPPGDDQAARMLERAGHRLDSAPVAMAAELDALPDLDVEEPAWSGDWDMEAAWAINDRAYGDTAGTWASALSELPAGEGHLYLARVANEPASFVLMHDHDGDCGFWFAATVPEARGRGLVTGCSCVRSSTHASAAAPRAPPRQRRWAGASTAGWATGSWERSSCGSAAAEPARAGDRYASRRS